MDPNVIELTQCLNGKCPSACWDKSTLRTIKSLFIVRKSSRWLSRDLKRIYLISVEKGKIFFSFFSTPLDISHSYHIKMCTLVNWVKKSRYNNRINGYLSSSRKWEEITFHSIHHQGKFLSSFDTQQKGCNSYIDFTSTWYLTHIHFPRD